MQNVCGLYNVAIFTFLSVERCGPEKPCVAPCTDKQNALRRECTFKIEIVLEIGVAGVIIYLKLTVLMLSDSLTRLAQSVRPWRMVIDFYKLSRRGHAFEPHQRLFIFLAI